MMARRTRGFYFNRVTEWVAAMGLGCAAAEPKPEPPSVELPQPTVVQTASPSASTSSAPSSSESIGALMMSSPVANAETAVAKLRPGFRACYKKGLANDPSMTGQIIIAIHIDPSGDVSEVTKAGGAGLSSDVEQCIIRKAKNGTFDSPGGNGAIVLVPVTFGRQGEGGSL